MEIYYRRLLTNDRNHTLNLSCIRCKSPDSLAHRLRECPRSYYITCCVFHIINFTPPGATISEIIISRTETTSFKQELKILGIIITLWHIHISVLNERNTGLILSFAEILNKIKASIIELLFFYTFDTFWPLKTRPIISQFISHIRSVDTNCNLGIKKVTLRYPCPPTLPPCPPRTTTMSGCQLPYPGTLSTTPSPLPT